MAHHISSTYNCIEIGLSNRNLIGQFNSRFYSEIANAKTYQEHQSTRESISPGTVVSLPISRMIHSIAGLLTYREQRDLSWKE